MTKEQLEEIEARAAKATPGPWTSNREVGWVDAGDTGVAVAYEGNSNFIAHARTDIPELIAHIRKLEAVRLRRRSAKRSKIEAMGGGEG